MPNLNIGKLEIDLLGIIGLIVIIHSYLNHDKLGIYIALIIFGFDLALRCIEMFRDL